jgi:hypothetical protein
MISGSSISPFSRAGLLQPAADDRVVVGVGEDDEAVGDEALGGVEQLDRVGQQGVLVGDHLQLDPVCLQRLAREVRGEHRVARGVAACGVRQHANAAAGEHVEDRPACGGVDPAHRHRRQLGSGRRERRVEHLEARHAAGAHDEP